jgi:hypothetical protein
MMNTFGPMSHIITIGKRYDIVDQRIIGDEVFCFHRDDNLNMFLLKKIFSM